MVLNTNRSTGIVRNALSFFSQNMKGTVVEISCNPTFINAHTRFTVPYLINYMEDIVVFLDKKVLHSQKLPSWRTQNRKIKLFYKL